MTDPITKPNEEYQYISLLKKIIDEGYWEEGRNGRTKSLFGQSMRFSLKNGKIPILTSKKTAWKTCLKELLWFIRGETNNKLLQEQNVHIWDGNASKEFMESRGLGHYPDGILGPLYGFQWRHFNAEYDSLTGKAVQRTSRRLIMSAWNPCQLDEMALPPCHIMCQFNVHDGNKLSCALYQRSSDSICGKPFNIASYSFLTHLLAKHCGLEAYEFVHFIGNCHIYEEHIDAAKIQIQREPYEFPTLEISEVRENISDYEVSDFILSNYECHEAIKVKMIV